MTAKCKHKSFSHKVLAHWMDVKVGSQSHREMVLTLRVNCSECGKSFIFKGETGWSTIHATTSIGGAELRVPIIEPLDDLPFINPDDLDPN